jgi:hypothetical protein
MSTILLRILVTVLCLGALCASPAEAATAEITFFKATKQYGLFPPYPYMGDKVEWSYTASWSTEGLKCHADVARWNQQTQEIGEFLHHQDYNNSPVSNSGNSTVSPGPAYRAHINVWGPGTPRVIYAADTRVEAPI